VKLAHCPFCGNAVKIEHYMNGIYEISASSLKHCCMICLEGILLDTKKIEATKEGLEKCGKAWNRRRK